MRGHQEQNPVGLWGLSERVGAGASVTQDTLRKVPSLASFLKRKGLQVSQITVHWHSLSRPGPCPGPTLMSSWNQSMVKETKTKNCSPCATNTYIHVHTPTHHYTQGMHTHIQSQT